ncbi:MAG: hypothetical protein NC191_08020, partial [Muribaculaceae bacterium]|nr:hypothetical protein [Muribaculaceae bacterium]
IKQDMAKRLGLPANVKIAAGAGDNAAAAIGTATTGNGSCNISLGTSGTIFISSDVFHMDSENALHAFAHADGHFHIMGCMLSFYIFKNGLSTKLFDKFINHPLGQKNISLEEILIRKKKIGKQKENLFKLRNLIILF